MDLPSQIADYVRHHDPLSVLVGGIWAVGLTCWMLLGIFKAFGMLVRGVTWMLALDLDTVPPDEEAS